MSELLKRGQLVIAIGNPLGFEIHGDHGRGLGARPVTARASNGTMTFQIGRAASDANDFEAEHEIYQDDAVLEYPQSGERIPFS